MSGGFFRGTSTDQDTRFSNKQAKLLKSQKFAPELEHLVDITKVKMDLMKPWIATRVTELLGFEDEVLINFIFGLLDGKEVNGKEVQISLTGFMEKNTGKFMKELWALLLSAQLNTSGVPQQFLDAKEEETRKMKVEADRIADEIRKKREKERRDMDQERVSKMDDRLEKITAETRKLSPWASNGHPFEKSNSSKRDGVRGAASERPRSRSLSKSPRAQSRSVSSEKSPRRHSPTTRRRYSSHRSRSPARRSSLYYRRSRSPIRHLSPSPARRRLQSPRRKSRSPRHHRLLTPIRRRRTPSPGWRRRAPSPVQRRRTPSPAQHRRTPSPAQHRRTPSPAQHRRTPSPARRRRTPSPARRRRTPSPARRRKIPSPARRRRIPSPVRGRTPSPVDKRKSSSAARQRSPFEVQLSPARRRSPSSMHRRSPSPIHTRALSPVQGSSVSPLHRKSLSPVFSRSPSSLRQRLLSSRRRESPDISRRKLRSPSTSSEKSPLAAQRRSAQSAGRSPLRVQGRSLTPSEKSFSLKSSSPSPAGRISLSPSLRRSFRKRSPVAASKEKPRERPISPYKNPKKQVRIPTENKRTTLTNESPVRHVKDRVRHDDSPSDEKQGDVRPCHEVREREENTRDKRSENSSALGKHRDSQQKMDNQGDFPPSKAIGDRSTESKGHLDGMEFRNKDQQRMREKSSVPGARYERVDRVKSQKIDEDSVMKKQKSDQAGIGKSNDKSLQLSNSAKDDNQLRSKVVEELVDLSVAVSDGGDTNAHGRKEKRSNKRSKRHDTESDDESYDSETEDRKEAKRRRRAEKKLRKKERRRQREVRHRKREERRAEMHKLRKTSPSLPSDSGQYQGDADTLDSPHANRKEIHSGKVEADPKQKKLEIELQLKALESFKAKKGIGC